jgi:hypothetical protein
MTEKEHEMNRGMKWIAERFAAVLGVTPDALDWERHSAGALLQVPAKPDMQHYVNFAQSQIADCADDSDTQKNMLAWIADHAKEAQRAPSSKSDPHNCPIE